MLLSELEQPPPLSLPLDPLLPLLPLPLLPLPFDDENPVRAITTTISTAANFRRRRIKAEPPPFFCLDLSLWTCPFGPVPVNCGDTLPAPATGPAMVPDRVAGTGRRA